MIIVSGKVKTAPGAASKVRADMETVITATRNETGCIDYSYGIDVLDPDTIIVLEYWESVDALKAHGATPHMATWMKTIGAAGVVSQNLRFHVAGDELKLFG